MYEQIASVLDSSRSYNAQSPSCHSSDSFSPRGTSSSAAIWMTPASQESALRTEPLCLRTHEQDEYLSEQTLPTRGERRLMPVRKHLLSDKSESVPTRVLPSWVSGGRGSWLRSLHQSWRARHMQHSLAYVLLFAQVLVAAALALYHTEAVHSVVQITLVWWAILGSLLLVSVQIVAWCTASLPDFLDVALSGHRYNSSILILMIKTIAWELLNLLDTWIFLSGINYLLIFQGSRMMSGVYLMSTAILSGGLTILSLKYLSGCDVWEHDPNSLYYDLDCVDLQEASPDGM